MADTTLSNLATVATLQGSDKLYVYDSSETGISASKAVTFQNFIDSISNAVAGGASGLMSGTDKAKVDGDWQDTPLARPILQDFSENVNSITHIANGTLTLDYSLGNVVDITVQANITGIVFINPPAAGRHGRMTLYFKQDDTGGHTVTLPSSLGTTLSISTLPKAESVIVYTSKDGFTTRYGFQLV